MTTRDLKVSELNHILPIVREVLKKEEDLKELREKANKLKRQIKDINNCLGKSNIVELGAAVIVTRSDLNDCISDLKNCKKQIREIEDYISASNLLFEGFSEMFNYGLLNCYITGGVLEVSELKEDYLYEYAYLIQNTSSLTVYRLLSMRHEVKLKVESIVKTELNTRKKIRAYLKHAIRFDKLL